nr:hypothetical protein [Tanacetum cinerariifolium]
MRTPRATLYEHNETLGGSIYWEPHVEGIPILVEGAYYDTIDEALDMYTKYAKIDGFEIKKGGQKFTKSGAVQHKYIYCNKEGVPKGESDAQMLINKMENRKMYNRKFIPFIGINNHRKCVALGSGMLLHEDTKSYTWLLNAFMTTFSHEPTMIVTDQDGAIKRAIESVFKKAKHILCMWYIMQNIPSNICKEIYDETNFKERFDKIVWNMFIEPLKFEEIWSKLIDSPLYGLMRTTSRSESENSFFKSFISPGATLVSLIMSYELSMERQRYRQEALDFKTIEAAPNCETK